MKLYFYKLSSDGTEFNEYEAEAKETPKMYIGKFPNFYSRIRKDETNQVSGGISNKWYITDYSARVEALNEFISAHEAKKAEYLDLAKKEDKIIDNIRKLMED